VVEGQVAVWIVNQGGWSGVLPRVQGWRETARHYFTHLLPCIGVVIVLLVAMLVLVIKLPPNVGKITLT
jgi:hypothetical protein